MTTREITEEDIKNLFVPEFNEFIEKLSFKHRRKMLNIIFFNQSIPHNIANPVMWGILFYISGITKERYINFIEYMNHTYDIEQRGRGVYAHDLTSDEMEMAYAVQEVARSDSIIRPYGKDINNFNFIQSRLPLTPDILKYILELLKDNEQLYSTDPQKENHQSWHYMKSFIEGFHIIDREACESLYIPRNSLVFMDREMRKDQESKGLLL